MSMTPPAYPTGTGPGPAHDPGVLQGPAPGLVFASFWSRFVGYVVDALLLFAAEAIVAVPAVYVPIVQYYQAHPVASGQPVPPLPSDLAGRLLVFSVLGAVISALYFGGLVAWKGRTIGQRVARLYVVRAEDGGRLPTGRAYARAVIFWGPGILGLVPYAGTAASLAMLLALLSVAWDPRRQGWHDKLGRSVVVKAVEPQIGGTASVIRG